MRIKEKLAIAASSVAAIGLGWLLPYLQIPAMMLVGRVSPLPQLLKRSGLTGSEFTWALYPFDFLALVIVALPVAFLITMLRPRHLFLYTALAVFPFFIVLNFLLLRAGTLMLSNVTLQQWITSLLVLPVAVLLVAWFGKFGRPNNSFKPTPLRGSA